MPQELLDDNETARNEALAVEALKLLIASVPDSAPLALGERPDHDGLISVSATIFAPEFGLSARIITGPFLRQLPLACAEIGRLIRDRGLKHFERPKRRPKSDNYALARHPRESSLEVCVSSTTGPLGEPGVLIEVQGAVESSIDRTWHGEAKAEPISCVRLSDEPAPSLSTKNAPSL